MPYGYARHPLQDGVIYDEEEENNNNYGGIIKMSDSNNYNDYRPHRRARSLSPISNNRSRSHHPYRRHASVFPPRRLSLWDRRSLSPSRNYSLSHIIPYSRSSSPNQWQYTPPSSPSPSSSPSSPSSHYSPPSPPSRAESSPAYVYPPVPLAPPFFLSFFILLLFFFSNINSQNNSCKERILLQNKSKINIW